MLGATSVQRGPLWWAAHHRSHHRHADTELDPHSPVRHGFLWSHMGWFLAQRAFRTDHALVPDLARYPELRWLDRFDVLMPVLLAIALFLGGAADMDAHFLQAPVEDNAVMWQALLSVWNRNALDYNTQAIIPYDERLEMLPSHLQQVLMESLGKSVTVDGEDCTQATSPVLMGASGNPSQHSFFQYLQQGIGIVPIDFIGVVKSGHCQPANHHFILANLLAQAQSLANGQGSADPQKRYPGNRPSSVILLDELTPRALGMLLALYEHSVFVQSKIWGINAFDQWGVELGKQIATSLMPYVEGREKADDALDPVTRELLARMLTP